MRFRAEPGLWPSYRPPKDLFREGLNPYLHCLRESGWEDDPFSPTKVFGEVPFQRAMKSFMMRDRFIFDFSFAIPCKEALEKLSGFGPIVEMGAGNGYWGYCLKELGCPVRLYDNFSYGVPWTTWWKRPRRGGPTILKKYGSDWTLFLCWPNSNGFASESVKNFKGERLAYIGETGGLCAERSFFDLLPGLGYDLKEVVRLPHWFGIRDNLFIFEREKWS